jgi:hypothetical protein
VIVLAPRSFDAGSRAPENPFDLTGLEGALLVVDQVTFAATNLAVVVGAGSLVVRFRRARGTERRQLQWVALAAGADCARVAGGPDRVRRGGQPGAARRWLRRGRPGAGPAAGAGLQPGCGRGHPGRGRPCSSRPSRRVQEAVDRRFNRRRHDGAATIEAFSGRRHQQIDLGTLTAELLALFDQTMQPTPRLALAPVLGHHAHRPTIS